MFIWTLFQFSDVPMLQQFRNFAVHFCLQRNLYPSSLLLDWGDVLKKIRLYFTIPNFPYTTKRFENCLLKCSCHRLSVISCFLGASCSIDIKALWLLLKKFDPQIAHQVRPLIEGRLPPITRIIGSAASYHSFPSHLTQASRLSFLSMQGVVSIVAEHIVLQCQIFQHDILRAKGVRQLSDVQNWNGDLLSIHTRVVFPLIRKGSWAYATLRSLHLLDWTDITK